MGKNKVGAAQRRLGLWSLMASGLVLGAAVLSSGATTPIKDAQTYACADSCYINYRTCLMAGKTQTYCATQYQNCNLQCTFGGAKSEEDTTS